MTARRPVPILILILAVVSISVLTVTVCRIRRCLPRKAIDPRYEQFVRMAEDGSKAEALELGDRLFNALLAEKPDDETLALLAKRLGVAKQIGTLVAGGVRSGQTKLLEGVAGVDDLGLAPPLPEDRGALVTLLPPAREVYWTSLGAFTSEPASGGLSARQAAFCRRYYDLRMQDATLEVGRQITVADPNSSENTCYAVVLPLLYLYGRDHTWGQVEPLLALFSPANLDTLSRFCLLQAERPQAAMALAQDKAKATGREFSPVVWALDAADVCITNHRPDLSEKLLCMVVADMRDRDTIAELRLKAANGYARCGDYGVAAQTCERIIADSPDTSLYGRTKATYLGYLAGQDKADQVIDETESVQQDPKCRSYLAQMLYLRWWALQKVKRQEEAAQIAQQLMEQHGGNPCVAPILLERATDALARQEYDRCRELLTRLIQNFPRTESAKRAEDILSRLKSSGIE